MIAAAVRSSAEPPHADFVFIWFNQDQLAVQLPPRRSAVAGVTPDAERDQGGAVLLPDFSENQSSGAPNWEPTPDFAGVMQQNGGAAIIRVSYGIDHLDHCFTRNRQAAQHHGYAFLGLYQYILPGDIAAQARAFCRWVGELAPSEIPIADIEEGSGDQSGRAETWFGIVDSALGLSPLPLPKRSWLYSGEDFLTHQLNQVCTSGRSIWVAAYRDAEPTLGHILWQPTDGTQGSRITRWVGAGYVDTNLFHGTLEQLAAAISRDDLPYSRNDLLVLIRQGVAAGLRAGSGASGVTTAQGAQAAVQGRDAAGEVARQVAELQDLIQQALPRPSARASGDPGTSAAPAGP
jgi:GH25 family lysozyme M1 (1,4-beta-N-acetylmuramidase)